MTWAAVAGAAEPYMRMSGRPSVVPMSPMPGCAPGAVAGVVMFDPDAMPEGPAGMASGSNMTTPATAPGAQPGMGDMGTTDGLPDMRMYGSAAPATAAQVIAAANLIKATGASLARFKNVQAAFAAGYTYV